MKLLALFLLLIAGTSSAQNPHTVDSILKTVDCGDTTNIQKTIDAIFIAKKIEYQKGEGTGYHKLGYLYTRKKNFPEALEKYLEAVNIRKGTGEKAKLAQVYVSISFLMAQTSNYMRSIKYAEDALTLNPPDSIKCDAYVSLGRSYMSQGQINNGIEYFKKAIKIRDAKSVCSDYFYLGNAYTKAKLYDSAIATLWKVNSLAVGRPEVLGRMYHCLGYAYHSKGELQHAELNYIQALDYEKSGQLYLNYAELLFILKNKVKAEYYLTEALKLRYDSEHLGRTLFVMEKFKESAIVRDCVNRESEVDYEEMRKESLQIARQEVDILKKNEVDVLKEANSWKSKMLWTGALIGIISFAVTGKYLWNCRYKIKEAKDRQDSIAHILKDI